VPSMSYCVFENTVTDMQTCVSMVQEAVDDGMSCAAFLADRGTYEAPMVLRLVQQAQELIELYEQLVANTTDSK